jgi:protein subunit release factor B
VKEWNQDVQNSKYLASNPWTNWFYSQKVVNAMEYIEIPEWDIAVPANIENE